jgi:hypothetical protein
MGENMLTPALAALALMFADTVPTAPPPAPPVPVAAPAPPVPPAPPAPDPVVAEVDAVMAPFKGKSGALLRGRLGLSRSTRAASDGQVIFWVISAAQETACTVDPASGAFRCNRGSPVECQLAIAFDTTGIVKAWAVTGVPLVCREFVIAIKGE